MKHSGTNRPPAEVSIKCAPICFENSMLLERNLKYNLQQLLVLLWVVSGPRGSVVGKFCFDVFYYILFFSISIHYAKIIMQWMLKSNSCVFQCNKLFRHVSHYKTNMCNIVSSFLILFWFKNESWKKQNLMEMIFFNQRIWSNPYIYNSILISVRFY